MNIRLGQFELIEPIGKGATSEVWRGKHILQDVPVAIKIMTEDWATRPKALAGLRDEVKAMASMSHGGIVRIFDSTVISELTEEQSSGGLKAGLPCVMMELATLGTLKTYSPKMDYTTLSFFITSILDALAHAHARKIIHSDIKPSNILVAEYKGNPVLKLADFGVSRIRHQILIPNEGSAIGTPRYMAPEQFQGKVRDLGPWTDLYSLGCLVYTILTGKPPYSGSIREVFRAHTKDPLPKLSAGFELPSGLFSWMEKLMEKDWTQRFFCAADAKEAFLEIRLPQKNREKTDLWVPALPEDWKKSSIEDRPSPKLINIGISLFGLRSIPFVGRKKERDILWKTLREVREKNSFRLVSIHGGRGEGKSRLARWFAERVEEVGGASTVFLTHNSPTGPHDGLVAGLKTYLGCDGLTKQEIFDRILSLYSRTGGEEQLDCIALANLFASRDWTLAEESEETKLQVKSGRETMVFLKSLLLRLCTEQPMVLIVDDAQWANEAFDFIQYLGNSSMPLMVLATIRSEDFCEDIFAGKEEWSKKIILPPLSIEEHHQFVGQLLPLNAGLVKTISQRTEGNPLFAVQLIEDWVDREILECDLDGFVIAAEKEVSVPESIQHVWNARLLKFQEFFPQGIEILNIAAILGVEVDTNEWLHVCEKTGLNLSHALTDYLLVHRLMDNAPQGWRFVHSMLHEAVLDRVSEDAKTKINRTIANLLELRENKSGAHLLRIARHNIAAESYWAGLENIKNAAWSFFSVGDGRKVLESTQKYEDLLTSMNIPTTDAIWGELLTLNIRFEYELLEFDIYSKTVDEAMLKISQRGWERCAPGVMIQNTARLFRVGKREEAEQQLKAVKQEFAAPIDRFDWLVAKGIIAHYVSDWMECLSCFQRAHDLVELIEPYYNTEPRIIVLIGEAFLALGRLESAEENGVELLTYARRVGNRYWEARALELLGEVKINRNDYTEALFLLEKTVVISRALDDIKMYLRQLLVIFIYIKQCRFQVALDYLQELEGELSLSFYKASHIEINSKLSLRCAIFAGLHRWEDLGRTIQECSEFFSKHKLLERNTVEALEIALKICREEGRLSDALSLARLAFSFSEELGLQDKAKEMSIMVSKLEK